MNEKKPRRLGTIFLIVLACAGAVACAKSSTVTPQVPTAFATMRLNPNGTLDTTFSSAGASPGLVITDLDPAQFDFATAVALQSDSSIIAAGQTVVNGQGVVAVVRYSASGILDTMGFGTAGTGGIVRTPVGSGDAEATAVAVQSDGKIVVAAITFIASSPSSMTGTTGFALLRYNADGRLDNGFGGGSGIVTGPIGTGTVQDTASLALQSDGKIIVAGATSSGSFVLSRFMPDGTSDATFGGGTVTTAVGAASIPPAVALQPDGNIVVAGGAVGTLSTTNFDVVLVRYDGTNGSLDTTFGNGGIVTTDIGLSVNYANAVAVQPVDSKIVVVGHANVNSDAGTSDIAVLRYKPDGTLDTTFGTNSSGIVVQDLGGFDNAFSVALQPLDGRIVVAGNSNNTFAVNLVVLRYNPGGTPDATFGPTGNGQVISGPIGPSNVTSANAIAVQADGKIVAVGYD
ncbi:MAG TPA: hypothetical protein VK572_08420 [Burkholderiales bacterium]|nr:hypothetical protein [Burkholderiales bacterium]